MTDLSAFIGHSFTDDDSEVVRTFLDIFDRVHELNIGFFWDHAEYAEPKALRQKVIEKMEGKNLFIGICTVKETVINPLNLHHMLLNKKLLKGRKESFRKKPSDWIIQEIGFAVARGMDIILLLEEGVREPGGLQADLEYIPFKRHEPEKSYKKILEMIQALRPKRIAMESGLVGQELGEEGLEEPRAAEDELGPTGEWTYDDYSKALLLAIINKNGERENDIYEAFINTLQEEEESKRICWDAERLYYKFIISKESNLTKMQQLAEQNPNEPEVKIYVGKMYTAYKEYNTAAEHFKQAASLSEDASSKIRGLCEAAKAYSAALDLSSKEEVLQQVKQLKDEAPDGNTVLSETLAQIARLENDDDSYFAFNESILGDNPYDHSRRFSLAYKYSEVGEDDLALYHYEILSLDRSNELDWNNKGVAESRLRLPCKSMESYRQPEKLGGTLAMSNIAHAFIDAGFLTEAEEICERATQIEKYDQQIGTAIARLKETRTNEDKKKEEYLKKTIHRRAFYTQYSSACLKPTIEHLKGKWSGPNGDMHISIDKTMFHAQLTTEQETPSWANSLTTVCYVRSQDLR